MEDSLPSPYDRKRRRNDISEDWTQRDSPLDKKSRPTLFQSPNGDERLWHPRDSVIGSSQQYKDQAKYDSDDQSSLMSEPGSPQALSQVSEEDVSMVSDDEAEAKFSPSKSNIVPEHGWRSQLQQTERAPTPVSPSLGQRLLAGHVRSRHPQENLSSDKIDVPSPIDEDEVPTPPSAAEAAGSQLQLLTVSDVEMGDSIPTIEVHQSERSLQLDGSHEQSDRMDADATFLRKGRARSGALSGGGSPMRESPGLDGLPGSGKRHFSMGYRADCAKCRERVPGHMNHFY